MSDDAPITKREAVREVFWRGMVGIAWLKGVASAQGEAHMGQLDCTEAEQALRNLRDIALGEYTFNA